MKMGKTMTRMVILLTAFCILQFDFNYLLARADVLLDKFGSADNVLQQSKDCIGNLKRASSLSGGRFSDIQLASFCAKEKLWSDEVRKSKLKLSDTPADTYTDKQRAWIDKIQQCRDWESCLCTDSNNCAVKGIIDFRDDPNASSRDRKKRKAPPAPISIRKEIRRMTDTERERFLAAVEKLKFDHIDNRSKYDMLTLYHRPESAPGAHWGPGFLGWHRELLRQFEVSLRQYDPGVTLPYWDSTLDEGLPDPKDSVLFTDSFIGGNDVKPFSHWKTYYAAGQKKEHKIARSLGTTPFGFLLKPSDVEQVLQFAKFDQLTMCVDPFFELVHGGPHNWIGGHMADIPISPDDPSFFLHHTFVDYVWERFRTERQTASQRKSDYPSDANSCNSHHFSNAAMQPYPKKNRDGISNMYEENFYRYEPSPTCKKGKPDCSSKYLFCDETNERCLSKIIPGGNCTGFEGSDICLNSVCREGTCVAVTIGRNVDGASAQVKEISMKQKHSENKSCICAMDGENGKLAEMRPFLYFPITVLSGELKDVKTPVKSAEILMVGTTDVGVHEGRLYESDTNFPHFEGNAVAKIPNPRFHDDEVDAFLTVTADGVKCKPYCNVDFAGYISCSGQVGLGDKHPGPTDLQVTAFEEQALFLAWSNGVYIKTHFMFLCNRDEIGLIPDQRNSISCRFQRFPGFELMLDPTDTVNNIRNSSACKEICRGSDTCQSLQYYALKEQCSVFAVNRITYPDKFQYNENEDVCYFDYRCDVDDAFEN